MKTIKLVAVKSLLLGAVLGATALLAQPAHADDYDGRGYQGGRHEGHAGWNAYEQRGQGRRFHRDYGWYAPDRYYNHNGNRGGRVWCPIRRTYVLAHQRYDDRGRHHRGRGDRDGRHGRHDDDRGYRGYRDRDRDYRDG